MIINLFAYFSIGICLLCFLRLLRHVLRDPQPMKIMNVVWPVTALYGGPLALWAYYVLNRQPARKAPFWQTVLKGTMHCGAGCTLGDLISATLLLYFPVVLLGSPLLGDWTIEYIAAFLLGIIFQYQAIKPMNARLSGRQALLKAFQADALSLTAWQVGMYGWMAICNFLIFQHPLKADEPVFWLIMQIGMLFGLLTAFPVNWWLIRSGIKEAM